jgi:WD40 repeat protein
VNLHGPVRAAAVEGFAEVVISFESWPQGKVASTRHQITVLAPRPGPKREPVTERLFKTLPHPDRTVVIADVRFSGDGKRMMMAGFPSGVVQLWDTTTWKETARLNTPRGRRNSLLYANPTPDWKTILVDFSTRKVVREEKGGKVSERMQIDGRIDSYDAATGKVKDSIPFHDRGPSHLFLLPDGKSALVNMEGSFTAATARNRPVFAELVDLDSKKAKTLCDAQVYPAFSPDGKTAYLAKVRYLPTGKVDSSLAKYDLVAGKVVKTVNPPEAQMFFDGVYVSPNGKWLVCTYRRLQPSSVALVLYSPETLDEVARLPGPQKPSSTVIYDAPLFSPDGRTMITRCGGPLVVWDLGGKKVARTQPVGDMSLGRMVLSPDGKRVVLVGVPPIDLAKIRRDIDLRDLPQPRAWLIDLSDAKSEAQVLILPEGNFASVALSPDGRTLAVGGQGGVHLVDTSQQRRK